MKIIYTQNRSSAYNEYILWSWAAGANTFERLIFLDGKPVKADMERPFSNNMRNNFSVYTMLIPGFLLFIIFDYFPMYGIVMAFQNFKPALGFFHSPFVGMRHFIRVFKDPYFYVTFRNTLLLGFYTLVFAFPSSIIFALMINEVKTKTFKRITQTVSYMPYFLSIVIVAGLMKDMLSLNDGVVNMFIQAIGCKKIDFFTSPEWFRTLYISSGIWQGIGMSSIIYMAAISGINPELYESARTDGASRLKQVFYITIPGISPTIVILFIFAVGGIPGSDLQKILLIYSPVTYSTSDVLSTYVYRAGILGANQGYAAAVGLFLSVVSLVLLVITNLFSKLVGETSLW